MHSTKTTDYLTSLKDEDKAILNQAASILEARYVREQAFYNVDATKAYLSCKLNQHDSEVFSVLMLDNQHRLIQYKELFYGTIDGASVYPREVVKLVLQYNAATVIFAHNHPSGVPDPSHSDKQITERLKQALALIDVRVLDHIIVGESTYSFAEAGLI